MHGAAKTLVTEDEYLALEKTASERHEFRSGQIVAMAGGSPLHNLICANLIRSLSTLLGGRSCLVLTSDQRVRVSATGNYAYPDVTVVCGAIERHSKDSSTITNPLVIFEVLSEGTEAFDRGAKFADYRSVPSLAEYVLVSTAERRVEHFRRVEVGHWMLTEARGDGRIQMPALDLALPLADLYDKIDLVSGE